MIRQERGAGKGANGLLDGEAVPAGYSVAALPAVSGSVARDDIMKSMDFRLNRRSAG